MQEPKFKFNDRVEFKDNENLFHVGYVKKVSRQRKGLFRQQWVYDICENAKGGEIRKVYVASERDIFGVVEKTNNRSDKSLQSNDHKSYRAFKDMKDLINE